MARKRRDPEPERSTDRWFELVHADGRVERVFCTVGVPIPMPTPEEVDALFAGFADPESNR